MSQILVERIEPEITIITLNRPEKLNALSYEMIQNLMTAFAEVDDDPECRVAVVTGAGRGFCSGFDIEEYADPPDTQWMGKAQSWMLGQKRYWSSLVPHMRKVHQPIIAAVNGPAVGGGLALAVGADIRVASESARFINGFIDLGLSGAEMGLSFLLPRMIGWARTAEFMLTGRAISADEAREVGLVSRVVPDQDLQETALDLAHAIVQRSPFGVWMTKEVLWNSREIPSLEAATALEARTQVLAEFTEDKEAALRAKRERSAATFRNR